ncbi:unnamed protein product [Toxocara canis]|uniref:Peptidase_M1_N domain-containing protein n=1 Tax=Toxocara canis TaxID=6265 RepID=A0A183V6P0_TOXCA|nr:unnamed protein product [Toxocara canis]
MASRYIQLYRGALRARSSQECALKVERYLGVLQRNQLGVYHREYSSGSAVLTRLKPEYARTLLPSFDDPRMKAQFSLSLVHEQNTIALGNTVAIAVTLVDDKWQRTVFAATPPLSTYLFAFAILPMHFNTVTRVTSFGLFLQVYAQKSFWRINIIADLILDCVELTASILREPLPMNKIDFLVVKRYAIGKRHA